jgi:hypothetical protein
MNPSPVVALNHEVAVAMDGRLEAGLNRIEALARGSQRDRYYFFMPLAQISYGGSIKIAMPQQHTGRQRLWLQTPSKWIFSIGGYAS